MTLEELKAIWDKAELDAKADPSNKALQVAAAKAKEAYDNAVAQAAAGGAGGKGKKKAAGTEESDDDEEDPADPDESKWDEKTKAYIGKLRNESATHRTKNKDLASKLNLSEKQKKDILKAAGIEDSSEKPEEKIKNLSAGNEELAFQNAVLQTAVKHGIAGEDVEYFEFLIRKATGELEDGAELSEDQVKEIAKKCKKTKSTTTSVNGAGGGKTPPNPDTKSDVNLDDFCQMTILEKSAFYEKNPDAYNTFMKAAKKAGRVLNAR